MPSDDYWSARDEAEYEAAFPAHRDTSVHVFFTFLAVLIGNILFLGLMAYMIGEWT